MIEGLQSYTAKQIDLILRKPFAVHPSHIGNLEAAVGSHILDAVRKEGKVKALPETHQPSVRAQMEKAYQGHKSRTVKYLRIENDYRSVYAVSQAIGVESRRFRSSVLRMKEEGVITVKHMRYGRTDIKLAEDYSYDDT